MNWGIRSKKLYYTKLLARELPSSVIQPIAFGLKILITKQKYFFKEYLQITTLSAREIKSAEMRVFIVKNTY